MKTFRFGWILLCMGRLSSGYAVELADISAIPPDLTPPAMVEGIPAAGTRVKVVARKYRGTEVYHCLYLPVNWQQGNEQREKTYPVIVEYAGNGPYRNQYGDVCTGRVEDCNLGYGISAGRDFIWMCLPYVSLDGQRNQLQWWGDVNATVEYCKTVVHETCEKYHGESKSVILAGFSRGSIACNFIGLHDDNIASLWRGFICHGHYDGVREWGYPTIPGQTAESRLVRLTGRPQFISHEGSVDETQKYLARTCAEGDFTFLSLPYRNHTDIWVLRDIPERDQLRAWVKKVLSE